MTNLFSTSRVDLIERMLRLPLRCWMGGTATGGSTTTLVDTARDEDDDYFNNMTPQARVYIVSTTDGAAPIGESRLISNWKNSTWTATITPAFSAAPASLDKYIILSEYTWVELAEAVNTVIDSLASKYLIPKVDETITMQSDTYEYTIPDDFAAIFQVTQEDSDGQFPEPVPSWQYRIVRGNTTKLKFLRTQTGNIPEDHWVGQSWIEDNLSDGKKLRIEGYARQQRLDTDQSLCYLNPNYIVYKAAALVLGSRITANDFDQYKVRRDECAKEAESFSKDLVEMNIVANLKWVGV